MMKFTTRLLLIFTLFMALSISLSAQNKTQFTIDDALNVKSLSVQSVTDDGKHAVYLAVTSRGRMNVDHFRFGDPTYISPRMYEMYVVNTESGESNKVFKDKVQVRNFAWNDDNSTLIFFFLKRNKYVLYTYDANKNKAKEVKIKTKSEIASNSGLQWSANGENIILSLRTEGWAKNARSEFDKLSNGPIIIQDSKDPFLDWERVGNLGRIAVLAEINFKSGNVIDLLPAGNYSSINETEDGAYLTYIETTPVETDYMRKGGDDFELKMLKRGETEPTLLVKKTRKRLRLTWNEAKTAYAYAEKGNVFVREILQDESLNLTEKYRIAISEEDSTKLNFTAAMWSPDSERLLVSSQNGFHLLAVDSKEMEMLNAFPEDKETAPNLSAVNWSADGGQIYFTYSAKDKWERGLNSLNVKSKRMQKLARTTRTYSSWKFSKSGQILYSSSNGDLPNELFVSGPSMAHPKKLTNLNPWLNDRTLTKSELVNYLDVDGKKQYGILYYPVGYEEGKKYPLVAEIYEKFFNNGFNHRMNIFANAGFFGFRPSVFLEEGFPGEGWMKGVTAGINKLIDQGLVDGDKLGVQGTSYGGYATNLLITQTDRFAAAINISGKVNIISFLGDSPKITTRNYDAAEVGQDRIGATLWEQPQKYIAHSAIMYADRITTPLLMLTGEGDWNVPATNQREMYYALRRLGKEVKWVNYMRAGHGAGRAGTVEDFHHHWKTVIDFYNEKFAEKDKKK